MKIENGDEMSRCGICFLSVPIKLNTLQNHLLYEVKQPSLAKDKPSKLINSITNSKYQFPNEGSKDT